MTKGIVMFAYNGEAHDFDKNKMNIDYIQMACANAKNIKKYMKNNNVALVTDQAGKDPLSKFDRETLFTHIILTNQTSEGQGPNTNIDMNIRSMRVGNKTIRLPWKNQTRPDA